jgi:hypothetical protein
VVGVAGDSGSGGGAYHGGVPLALNAPFTDIVGLSSSASDSSSQRDRLASVSGGGRPLAAGA